LDHNGKGQLDGTRHFNLTRLVISQPGFVSISESSCFFSVLLALFLLVLVVPVASILPFFFSQLHFAPYSGLFLEISWRRGNLSRSSMFTLLTLFSRLRQPVIDGRLC